MERYGKEFQLSQDDLDVIATYMDDDIRERLHGELAPCEPEEFLKAYVKEDPDFKALLLSEFKIEL